MNGKSEDELEEEFILVDGFEKKEKFLKEFIQEKILPPAIKKLGSTSLEPQQVSSFLSIGELNFESLKIPLDSNSLEVHIEDREYMVVTVENCDVKLKPFTWKYSTSVLEDSGTAKIHFKNAKSSFRFRFSTSKIPPTIELKIEKFQLYIHESGSQITSMISQQALAEQKAIVVPWLRALQL